MEIYINKKINRVYVLVEEINIIESRFLCINDGYTYTIPINELMFVVNDKQIGFYKRS
jgi:hypothetical protein